MKKRYAAVMAGVLLLAVGCGRSLNEMDAYEEVVEESAAADTMAAPADTYESEEEAGSITSDSGIETVDQTGRKLIKTVYLSMQTKEFDTVLDGLSAKVQETGGYTESSSVSGSSYYYDSTRNAYFTIRVPSQRLDEFIDVVSGLGNVTQKSENVEDVTLQYVDAEGRKKTLETEQERLIQLLEQAENMEDLLAIESKLSDVRYELENYGSQLRLLDNQIDYSTVNVEITEVERVGEVKDRTFFGEISERFGNSLYMVGRGIRGFLIGFIGSLPILAVWAAIIAGIAVLIRRAVKGRKKQEKRLEQTKTQEDLPTDPKS